MKKQVIFIKLGGSVITDKQKARTFKQVILERLVGEIIKAKNENKEIMYIVGHGHGSFGHAQLKKYQTTKGFINKSSLFGSTSVLDEVNYVNQVVVHEFIKRGVPAISFRANHLALSNNGKVEKKFLEILDEFLNKGLLPIPCGDIIYDRKKGCIVWSTEKVFAFLIKHLQNSKVYKVGKIVHVGEVDGFFDKNKEVVKKITNDNWELYKTALFSNNDIDMTGAMSHKINECLKLAENDISSIILSGTKNNNLYNFLTNKKFIGTKISK